MSSDVDRPSPPRPVSNPMTDFFWEGLRKHRLLILRCQGCGWYVHYPRPICPRCQATDLAPNQVSGQATVYAYTVTVQAFHPYYLDKLPYTVGIVELIEQPKLRLTTNIIECAEEDLRIGMPVEVVFETVDADFVLPMFRPVPVPVPVATLANQERAPR